MKKRRILKNIRLSDLSFDELYDEFSNEWELRAERLQNRRWRRFKKGQEMAA